MGFKKEAPVAESQTEPKTDLEKAIVAATRTPYTPDEARVRGQVRMHAIIAGYKVSGVLAPTLANTAASIKDELHKLAAEIAEKIEAYSFNQ